MKKSGLTIVDEFVDNGRFARYARIDNIFYFDDDEFEE